MADTANACEPPAKRQRTDEGAAQAECHAPVVEHADAVVVPPEDQSKKQRKPKRRVALLVGYLGARYRGMQLNKSVSTVEGVLLAALHRAGAISDDNAGSLEKVKWSRCTRTDKGVSAALNVCSFNMIIEPDIVKDINKQLEGTDIRVYDFRRTTTTFDAKRRAEARAYEFVVPAFAFQHEGPVPMPPPRMDGNGYRTYAELQDDAESEHDGEAYKLATLGEGVNQEKVSEQAPGTASWAELSQQSPVLEYVRGVLKLYERSHNYHNFAYRKKGEEANATRFIQSFTCGDPFTINGMQLVPLRVVGQSFMKLQVRHIKYNCTPIWTPFSSPLPGA
eukprot:TRINITY_DN2614_c0_g1_i4.p1 TRINITY_DN2614_c0_g1~~TRINITY_DN2614_c0_g1_i4.p1  ORF type:complete len:335 (-),score=69.73 TRINITY_DN2614_c0_g1_i4:1532-2536(-)